MGSRQIARKKARRVEGKREQLNERQQQIQMKNNDTPQRQRGEANAKCHHGLLSSFPSEGCDDEAYPIQSLSDNIKCCKQFLERFVQVFDAVGGDFLAAYHGTKEDYADFWGNLDKMKLIISFLITCGTSKVLEGQTNFARKYASLANYFEQYLEVEFLNKRLYPNWPKMKELYSADENTLVSYLRKRIPCSCLDAKYKQVKSISKIGICMNPGCHLPGGVTERSAMKCCSRCHLANYCSKECQEAAWPDHKAECDVYDRIVRRSGSMSSESSKS